MTGALLYKDAMVLRKNSRFLLILMIPFLLIAAVQPENLFFVIYPAVALSTMGLNSLSYDTSAGWDRYADALPYGRRRVVTAKYLMMLLGMLGAMAVLLGMIGLRVLLAALPVGLPLDGFSGAQVLAIVGIMLMTATLYAVVLMPMAIKFGLEKTRLLYVIFICAGVLFLTEYLPTAGYVLPVGMRREVLAAGFVLVCGILWVVSWRISVGIYQKKEF